ncbi:uncharacterized protein LOC107262935 isoform X3 [Cephus cinctus]|uniref:Uncharacterized protein LOC107262935 isoform X3 n=1 Tax=Cephus cinctus TaxID=211228 RepID=A0AAJ7R843_CEPCN|nr:uncharacterized protein LOC107262935 isoform X3 [Cephus cinctus]
MSDRPRHGRLPIGRSQREKENEGVTKHENERQTSGIIIVSRGNVGRISNTWAYHVHRIEDRLAGYVYFIAVYSLLPEVSTLPCRLWSILQK